MPDEPLEQYQLGRIRVEIRPSAKPNRLDVVCDDGTFRSSFDISTYEAAHYRRLMNQRITRAFKSQHDREGRPAEDGGGDATGNAKGERESQDARVSQVSHDAQGGKDAQAEALNG